MGKTNEINVLLKLPDLGWRRDKNCPKPFPIALTSAVIGQKIIKANLRVIEMLKNQEIWGLGVTRRNEKTSFLNSFRPGHGVLQRLTCIHPINSMTKKKKKWKKKRNEMREEEDKDLPDELLLLLWLGLRCLLFHLRHRDFHWQNFKINHPTTRTWKLYCEPQFHISMYLIAFHFFF